IFSLTARPSEEVDRLVAACILHVVKAFVQELVPILALGHVMDHRAEDYVIVCVPPVFEEQDFSAGLQDAARFAEQLLSRTARGNFMRPEPKTNGFARSIRQRHVEMVGLVSDNARAARWRHFQVAYILYGFLGRLAF